jgi:hypothetical protein
MKARFILNTIGIGHVVLTREDSDPKFHGILHAKGEHALFYFIKKWLNARGFSLIKKRAQNDGHLVDEYQPYLRSKKGIPDLMIISGFYALRGANEDWNKGSVTLEVIAASAEME